MTTDFILAADVGATNTRLRLASATREMRILAEESRPSGSEAELESAIRSFVRDNSPEGGLTAAAIGLPGKISSDRRAAAITYLDPDRWVDFGGLFDELGVERGQLLNDVECGVRAIPAQRSSQLAPLTECDPAAASRAERFVIGMPGTGFGIGFQPAPGLSLPSEGGHIAAAFDPGDDDEQRVRRALVEAAGDGPPSYQDLVRGGAIPRIFEILLDEDAGEAALRLDAVPPGDPARSVERLALSGSPAARRAARRAFRCYGRFLGRAMQAVTLVALPAAVFLAGGIVASCHELFADSFRATFPHHPVHSGYLERLPVIAVSNRRLNLDGATRAALDALSKS